MAEAGAARTRGDPHGFGKCRIHGSTSWKESRADQCDEERYEIYYAHFGEFFAPAIAGQAEADLDQDKQVSVLEAFLYASKKSAEFYEKENVWPLSTRSSKTMAMAWERGQKCSRA